MGRRKGSLNKRTTYSVKQRLEERGVDLIGLILDDIRLMDRPFERAKCYLQLLEYCDARRKAIEVIPDSSEREKIKEMSTLELVEIVKQNLSGAV